MFINDHGNRITSLFVIFIDMKHLPFKAVEEIGRVSVQGSLLTSASVVVDLRTLAVSRRQERSPRLCGYALATSGGFPRRASEARLSHW